MIRQMIWHVKLPIQGVIAGRPSHPTIAETHDDTSVTISITAPSDWGTGIGRSYTLETSTTGELWTVLDANPSFPYTVTGLIAESTHWYRAKAYTNVGYRYSNELQVTLDPTPPTHRPSKPRNVVGTPGNSQISVAFDPPLDLGVPPGLTYTATATPHAGGSGITNTGSSSPIVVSTLSNGTGYDVTVHLTNTVGDGPESDLDVNSTNITPTASVPDAPTSLISGGTNYATIVPLSWTAPASDGGSAITGYKVRYRVGVGSWTTVSTGSTSTSYTVNSLTASTTYEFQVAATNAVGDSSWSSSHNETTTAAWSITSVSGLTEYFDADNTTFSSGNLTAWTDLSGGGHDCVYESGSRQTKTTGVFFGKDGISPPNSANVHRSTNTQSYTAGAAVFIMLRMATTVSAGANGVADAVGVFGSQCTDTSINNSDTAPLSVDNHEQCLLYSGRYDSSAGAGHNIHIWKNGDQSSVGHSSAGPLGNSTYTYLGQLQSGSNFFRDGHIRRYALFNALPSAGDIEKIEGLFAWDVPTMPAALPVSHTYRTVSPTGVISVPSAPSVITIVSASGQITVYFYTASEGGAQCTFTLRNTGGSDTVSGTGTRTHYGYYLTLTGLTDGTTYNLGLKASNLAGSSSETTFSFTLPNTGFSTNLVHQFRAAETGGWLRNNLGGLDIPASKFPTAASIGAVLYPARIYNGSDQYCSITPTTNAQALKNTDFTIEAWFVPQSTAGGNYRIFSCRENNANIHWNLNQSGSNILLDIGDGTGGVHTQTVISGFSTNTKYHFIGSFTASTKTVRYRVNGGSVQSYTPNRLPNGTIANMKICIGGNNMELFNGSIGMCRAWTQTTSDADMLTIYNSGTPLDI